MIHNFTEHFLSQIKLVSDCWWWTGAYTPNGYGKFYTGRNENKKRIFVGAHRYSYQIFKGSIPEGLVLDHLCRNKRCVNPRHLEPVTTKENVARGATPTSFCPKGHAYEGYNLYILPNGYKQCRDCNNDRHRRRRQELKGIVV